MKAALVVHVGQTPVYGDAPDPVPATGEVLIDVKAAALSNLVKAKAAGNHYTVNPDPPFVVGVDGTGTLSDGSRVYFFSARPPMGAMAQRVAVPLSQCVSLPDDLDDVSAAALANPGMSSWAALVYRAGIKPGETVLINGATGVSGRLAVSIARHLGAGKIIATGRNADVLNALRDNGASETISLTQDPASLSQAFNDRFQAGVDIVLDYLWGESAEVILGSIAKVVHGDKPIRFVQIGGMSGPTITLPAGVLRSTGLMLMGSGIGSVSTPNLIESIRGVLSSATESGFHVDVETAPLESVHEAWDRPSHARLVFVV